MTPRSLRWAGLLATLGGLAAGLWAIGRVGFAELFDTVLRIGWRGFILFTLCSLLVSIPLAAAWLVAAPRQGARQLPLFLWARQAREAANDLLPFSQFGGLAVAARTLIARGLDPAEVYAAMMVDLSTELAAQLLFTVTGLAALGALLDGEPNADQFRGLAWGGAGMSILVIIGFVTLQRPALRLVGRIGGRMLPQIGEQTAAIHAALARIYRLHGAVAASFAFNLLAWTGTVACSWLALRLLGGGVSFWAMVAIESLIFALRGLAFIVPGAVGVQEAGYALLGPLVGIAPETALALSLVKRARDVAIGVPVLLLWNADIWRGRSHPSPLKGRA